MEWIQGNDAGSQLAPVRKLLLHTTEGSSVEGAVAAYQANNSWPHETVDYRFGYVPRRVGHLTADRAARSLRNESGGVETNRDGVYQIEVVGFATRPQDINWERLARDIIGPLCASLGVPVVSTVSWVAYPDSYGQGAAQRLSGSAWDFYEGILGHQHCPENSHGDPGLIPIKAILEAAGASPTPTPVSQQEDDHPVFAYNPGNQKSFILDVGWLEVSNDCFKRAEKLGWAISPTEADFGKLVEMADRKKAFYDNIALLVEQGNLQRGEIVAALSPPPPLVEPEPNPG